MRKIPGKGRVIKVYQLEPILYKVLDVQKLFCLFFREEESRQSIWSQYFPQKASRPGRPYKQVDITFN